jgi:hypothetical protein
MRLLVGFALSAVLVGCRSGESSPPGAVTPVYSPDTGRLVELVSDRDGDGRAETRAFMDGVRIVRVEIDRDGDGHPDRREYYQMAADRPADPSVIDRAEEYGPEARVVRRESYEAGLIARVEADTDADGRTDKWEFYLNGVLDRVELDLVGRGVASQRLAYGPGGAVVRVESDADGDGVFTVVGKPGDR